MWENAFTWNQIDISWPLVKGDGGVDGDCSKTDEKRNLYEKMIANYGNLDECRLLVSSKYAERGNTFVFVPAKSGRILATASVLLGGNLFACDHHLRGENCIFCPRKIVHYLQQNTKYKLQYNQNRDYKRHHNAAENERNKRLQGSHLIELHGNKVDRYWKIGAELELTDISSLYRHRDGAIELIRRLIAASRGGRFAERKSDEMLIVLCATVWN